MRILPCFKVCAFYGKVPLSIISYPPGSSRVAAVDDVLIERDGLLRRLRENLLATKNRMKLKANLKRREVEFNNGSLAKQILVQWVGRSLEEATWEYFSDYQTAYPAYGLEDKIVSEE
ncbi:hypothetical protein Tco_0048503 [Tanacetum coccineum]